MKCLQVIFVVSSISSVALADEEAQALRGSLAGERHLESSRSNSVEVLDRPLALLKAYNLSGNFTEDFDIEVETDAEMTHSCANYTEDGETVFTRDDSLVLKVASACPDGTCLNSGRVMSKEGFRYGVFVFKATVPKCNYIWPALWLLPSSSKGDGEYGTWPCSGEIDVLETVHGDAWGAFNLVAGFGDDATQTNHCAAPERPMCSCAAPDYCTSTTLEQMRESFYFVEDVDCSAEHPSWSEHTFVLLWQVDRIATWVDPKLTFDAEGSLVDIKPGRGKTRMQVWGEDMDVASWKAYERTSTPTWQKVQPFMEQCFPENAGADAPFDKEFKIVLNIAIGGYEGSPCSWGSDSCTTTCGGAVGSELVISELKVYQ
jgi:hypothetical protein